MGQGLHRFAYHVVFRLDTERKGTDIDDWFPIGVNDAIAEATLNFRGLFAKAFAQDEPKRILLDRQWIEMHHPNYNDGVQGRVELTVELVPASEAAKSPVGLGRDEPNREPFLDEPKRPEKSFNPLRADKWVKVCAKLHF